jgi:gp32 DNA binding protein like
MGCLDGVLVGSRHNNTHQYTKTYTAHINIRRIYMVDFATLKRNRSNELNKLQDQLKKITTNETSSSDDRMWYPDVDKTGNGYAVIRFLPAPPNEDVPFIRVWNHGFKGATTGLWYIENSLTTIGQTDPVSEYNTQLWNSTSDDNSPARKQARDQKRKLSYISNIYVVKDPANPQNEGKVKLFKYGKKIFDKLNEAMNPQFDDEKPLNPFDLWEGANFKIKIRNVDGYRNYDKSEFDTRGPLLDDDDDLEKLWKSEYSLQEFLNPKNFKDYDTLKKKLYAVLGLSSGSKTPSLDEEDELPRSEAKPQKMAPVKSSVVEEDDVPWSTEEDDDDLSYFKKLAAD